MGTTWDLTRPLSIVVASLTAESHLHDSAGAAVVAEAESGAPLTVTALRRARSLPSCVASSTRWTRCRASRCGIQPFEAARVG